MTQREKISMRRSWSKLIICWLLAIVLIIAGLKHFGEWYGILAIVSGIASYYGGKLVEFTCSYCGKKIEVSYFSENKKCKKCETLYVIEWE